MSKFAKMLAAMQNNPRDVRWSAFLTVVAKLGWERDRVDGSHFIYLHLREGVPSLTLQEGKGGKAKAYQVRQMLAAVVAHGLEKEDKS